MITTIIVTYTQCLKITEKVSFNVASEASYVYILSGQMFIKHAKNVPFWRVFENLACLRSNSVTRCILKISSSILLRIKCSSREQKVTIVGQEERAKVCLIDSTLYLYW